jgi:hypothetical protein
VPVTVKSAIVWSCAPEVGVTEIIEGGGSGPTLPLPFRLTTVGEVAALLVIVSEPALASANAGVNVAVTTALLFGIKLKGVAGGLLRPYPDPAMVMVFTVSAAVPRS